MAYRYRCKIAELAEQRAECKDLLYSMYCTLQGSKFSGDMMHRRAAQLATDSKAHFAQAVKLDSELKGMINDAGLGNSDS